LPGGETRPKPFGTGKHSKMQRRLLHLPQHIFDEGLVEFELSVRIGGEVPVPAEMLAKCQRYHGYGVPFCWVIDPVSCRAWEYHRLAELGK
jgi:hypothetical protein